MRTAYTRMLENKLRELFQVTHIDCTQNLESNSYNLILVSENFREKRIGKKGAKKRSHKMIISVLKDYINTSSKNRIEKFNILSIADTDWDNTLNFPTKNFTEYLSKDIIKTLPGTLVK